MKPTKTVTLLALITMPLVAVGQDSGWDGEAELGVLVTTGNSEEINFTHVSDAPPGSDNTDTETSVSVLYGF